MVKWERGAGRGREVRIVLALESVVLAALLVALAVANVKMVAVLDRVGVPRWRGLPLTGLFLGVGYLVIRRLRRNVARFRSGRNDV
jgi:hypothetical protein